MRRVTQAKGAYQDHPLQYYDTMMRYYLHVDPDQLNDEEWAITIKQLEDIRQREYNANRG